MAIVTDIKVSYDDLQPRLYELDQTDIRAMHRWIKVFASNRGLKWLDWPPKLRTAIYRTCQDAVERGYGMEDLTTAIEAMAESYISD